MRFCFLLILWIVIPFAAFAQEGKEFVLFGKIIDATFKEPIPNVAVHFNKQKVYTNEEGEFFISITYKKPSNVKFTHVGYNTLNEILTDKMVKQKVVNDTLFWNKIRMKSPILDGVVISSARKVDTVFGSPQYSVEDYAFLPENKLLLLAYEKTLKKQAKLLLTNSKQNIISTYTLPCTPLYLYTDYAENQYVVCKAKIYQINIRKDVIYLLEVSKDEFFNFHQRVIDTIGDNYYYTNYNELYPAVKFYVTERNDTSHSEIYEVKDDFMMELYRAQYKYVSGRDKLWAYRKEQETGIDKEIWIGASSFTQDILYKPVYAPLFVINDTVMIFDQYKNKILKFDEYNDPCGECFMNYQIAPKGEKWEQPIIRDKVKNYVFAIYNGGGYTYIRELKYSVGKIGTTTKLKFRFIENIQIENGYVYYIYRPFESSQKRFLYREELSIK